MSTEYRPGCTDEPCAGKGPGELSTAATVVVGAAVVAGATVGVGVSAGTSAPSSRLISAKLPTRSATTAAAAAYRGQRFVRMVLSVSMMISVS